MALKEMLLLNTNDHVIYIGNSITINGQQIVCDDRTMYVNDNTLFTETEVDEIDVPQDYSNDIRKYKYVDGQFVEI